MNPKGMKRASKIKRVKGSTRLRSLIAWKLHHAAILVQNVLPFCCSTVILRRSLTKVWSSPSWNQGAACSSSLSFNLSSSSSSSLRVKMSSEKYYDVMRAKPELNEECALERLCGPTFAHLTNKHSHEHILKLRFEFNTRATDVACSIVGKHRPATNTSICELRLVLAPEFAGSLDSHEVLLKRIKLVGI